MTRTDRRSLALHAAVDDRLRRDPVTVLRTARRGLRTMRTASGGRVARRLFDEWDELLEGPIAVISAVLRSTSEHARDLRQVSPFAGVLDDGERRAVIAAVAMLQ